MKDAEKSIVGNSESYSTFKSRLEKLPDNVVVIGSHTHTDNRKEKVSFVQSLCFLIKRMITFTFSIFIDWVKFDSHADSSWWVAFYKIW